MIQRKRKKRSLRKPLLRNHGLEKKRALKQILHNPNLYSPTPALRSLPPEPEDDLKFAEQQAETSEPTEPENEPSKDTDHEPNNLQSLKMSRADPQNQRMNRANLVPWQRRLLLDGSWVNPRMKWLPLRFRQLVDVSWQGESYRL